MTHARTLITLAAAITLFGGAGAARADDSAPSVRVRFADLDLTRTEGAETLHRRLHAAARRVCNVDEKQPPLKRAVETRCIRESVDRAYMDAAARGQLPEGFTVAR